MRCSQTKFAGLVTIWIASSVACSGTITEAPGSSSFTPQGSSTGAQNPPVSTSGASASGAGAGNGEHTGSGGASWVSSAGEAGVSSGGGASLPGAGAPPVTGSDPPYRALKCTTRAVGASPLRRLTHAEYDNAVRDLIGDRTQPASVFPSDTQVGLFDNTASVQSVPELLAEKYLDAAATLAEGITNVAGLVGCDYAAAGAGECVASFVNRFGRRAFRRPLNGDEIA
ncbi:MAG TPA: DUF1587 domain-containing protein, partial [Polyangiaceae bacterium]|nr:DUF1587 domain-containing protein [Polyangiaceae bacterium]